MGPTTAARPKRAAEDFARAYEPTTKKLRFDSRNPSTLAPEVADDDEDDVVLDADVIGKSGAQTKRNAVNIDGYESDSDNDNFDARAAEKARERRRAQQKEEKGNKEDEDEDMFAEVEENVQGTADGDDDEDLTREGKKKRRDVRILDAAEIEGQVMDSTSGGHVSADLRGHQPRNGKRRAGEDGEDAASDSESSSGDEEDRDQLPDEMEDADAAEIGAGGKKKHAPRLDAFNLKEEEQDGRYDDSGNFVRKAADPDAVNDNWLDGLSRKDMKRAREAQERREEEQRRRNREDDAVLTSDLLATLIQHLETGESPLEALQRLNKVKPKETKLPKWKQKKIKDKMDVDATANGDAAAAAADPREAARKRVLEAITGAADALYTRGQHDIYDSERELLMRQYKRDTGEDWQPTRPRATSAGEADEIEDSDVAQWEYRWSDARDGGEAHGPYDAAMMKSWHAAGYFGEGVEFRQVGTGEWSRVLDVR